MVTFCLAPAQRADLRDAAAALEVADHTATIDPAAWRKAAPGAFDRACAALYHARKAPPVSVWSIILPFLTGFVTSMLAFGAAAWRDQVARGRELGDRLRNAVTAFHEAAEAYLHGVKVGKPDTEIVSTRRKLDNELAAVKARRPRWTLTDVVRENLSTGELGARLTMDWDRDTAKAQKRSERLGVQLAELRDRVLIIANELGVPLGRHRAVKSAES